MNRLSCHLTFGNKIEFNWRKIIKKILQIYTREENTMHRTLYMLDDCVYVVHNLEYGYSADDHSRRASGEWWNECVAKGLTISSC